MIDQTAELKWQDGNLPVSSRFDDPYFARQNGLAESRHVFLAGNNLPARFRSGFHIAELGFGTGLNFLASLQAWNIGNTTGQLHFTSFEAYPMHKDDMARALAGFELPDTAELLDNWHGAGRYQIGPARLTVIVGDARLCLPEWTGRADAWFLDGFSPAKNPEMWGANLLAEVARHTNPKGTAATYSAAGHIRRKLSDAGFEVSRCKGYGHKRHMTSARLAVSPC